jgi:hypothetical protein
VFIADFYNSKIRKVDISGMISTIAGSGTAGYSGDGGPATAAELFDASALAVDDTGNVYISDYYNSRIRKVDTNGIISTVAGNGTGGYSGDYGPATAAEIMWPEGVAIDTGGRLFIADYNNSRVREVKKYVPSLSIKNATTLLDMDILPNPCSGKFMIRTSSSAASGSVYVYNIIGEKVFESTLAASEMLIDVSAWPPGIYEVRLTSLQQVIHKTLIKNK